MREKLGAKTIFARLMIFFVLIAAVLPVQSVAADGDGPAQPQEISVTDAVYGAAKYILADGSLSDWDAIALARSGEPIPGSYLAKVEADVKGANGTYSKVTDYERIVLGITAAGGDATNFAGYNLVEKIYNFEDITNQGVNGPVYGLLALDSGNYSVPKGAKWDRGKLVKEILDRQLGDGGFALFGSTSDPDMTGLTLTALAPYKDQPDVKTAGERAVEWLSAKQNANGGYTAFGSEASESVAQAIIGLTSFGIDPTEERFTKNGTNLLTKLMSYRNADGGFATSLSGKSNPISTYQALQALVAYQLLSNDEGRYYWFKDGKPSAPVIPVAVSVVVEGSEGAVASGDAAGVTALEALENMLAEKNILLGTDDFGFGVMVTSINGTASGEYGGYDGWFFGVHRGGEWIYPQVGMADFELEPSDTVLVYYYDYQVTHLVESVKVQPLKPLEHEKFTVTVSKISWDFGPVQITPAAGVKVTIGNKEATTNAQGVATFTNGLAAGTYNVVVTGYSDNSAPSVVRHVSKLTVAADSSSGGTPAVPQVTLSVTGDSNKGVILSSRKVTLEAGDTPFSILERALPGKVQARGSGASLYVEAIDGLAEFDRGEQSGWVYSVNGTVLSKGAGTHTLKTGDVIAWKYTLDLGKDVDGNTPSNGSGSIGGGGPATETSTTSDIDLPIGNTLPLSEVGKTTALQNADEKMNTTAAEELREALAENTVSLSKEITPSSETVMTDGKEEVRFVIPAGALSSTITININELASANPDQLPGLVSGLYEFTPAGTEFDKPVEISIRVPVTIEDPENLVLAWLNEQTNEWIPIAATIDLKTGIITGKIDHFTKFAVIDRTKVSAKAEEKKPASRSVASDIEAAIRYMSNDDVLSDWEAFAFIRAGASAPKGFLAEAEASVKQNEGEFRKVTDLERIAISVAAAGGDPLNVAGYNLIERIYNHKNMTMQGVNGPIFALIALDSGNYTVPITAAWQREQLIDWILEQQSADGGFPLVRGSDNEVDLTAMAITALAPYKSQPKVKSALDKAVEWLSKEQLNSGGFKLVDHENSESAAQVIIALTAYGINPLDSKFVKEKGDVIANLLSFQNKDGGFAHKVGEEATDAIATEQALMALVAYDRFVSGKQPLFRLSSANNVVKFVDDRDISEWAEEYVYKAYERKLMTGVSASELRFAPQEAVTRAQFAALLVRLKGEQPAVGAEQTFTDVNSDSWYYGYVMKAKQLGVVTGVTTTEFMPDQPVTRQEMAIMIGRTFGWEASGDGASFVDGNAFFADAERYAQAAFERGVMIGYDGYFHPTTTVTRETAAVVVVRSYELATN